MKNAGFCRRAIGLIHKKLKYKGITIKQLSDNAGLQKSKI
jgi:lambda repressor-like predicted transcriptional regulator